MSPTHETLLAIYGISDQSAWAVGENGTTLRWDGSNWSFVASPSSGRLVAVWGSADDDVWVAEGNQAGSLFHWDGGSWAQTDLGPSISYIAGLSGVPGGPLYVASQGAGLVSFDGSSSGTLLGDGGLFSLDAVWAASSDEVVGGGELATGGGPVEVSWDGAAVSSDASLQSSVTAWHSAWADRDAGTRYLAGYGTGVEMGPVASQVARFSAGAWTVDDVDPLGVSVWGRCEPEVWVGGLWSIARWTGSAWQREPIRWVDGGTPESGYDLSVTAIGGTPSHTWAVGGSGVILKLVRE